MVEFERVDLCFLCAVKAEPFYQGLWDKRFATEGTFDMSRCPHCGLLWVNPRPVPEAMSAYYADFYAGDYQRRFGMGGHRFLGGLRDFLRESILCGYYGYHSLHKNHAYCFLGRGFASIEFLRFKAAWDLGELFPRAPNDPQLLLVDVGCGEGAYLQLMKEMGWRVLGVEPHSVGVAACRKRGVDVIQDTAEHVCLPQKGCYQISLNHVLEHLFDPLAVMGRYRDALIDGGRLVLRVPNVESLGHRIFRQSWYALDPPRHLYGFTVKSLRLFFQKLSFSQVRIKTIARFAKVSWDQSSVIAESGRTNERAPVRKGREWFALKESLACLLGQPAGEEIEVVAVK